MFNKAAPKKTLLLLIVLLLFAGTPFAAEPKEERTDAQKKIGSPVLSLAEKLKQGAAQVKAFEPEKLSGPFSRIDKDGRVQLYIKYSSDKEKLAADINSAGGRVEIVSEMMSVIQAWVPYDRIEELAGKEYVAGISFPGYAVTQMGSVTTEGDAVLYADKVRSLFGYTGSGFKVGVISNGINGITNSLASGDIPASYQAQSARADNNLNAGAEGLAMMEIVYDLAPNAALAFSNPNTSVEMLNAIQILGSTFGCDIIVDDLNFFDTPFFEDGPIAQKVADFASQGSKGKVYVTSAGNYAGGKYYEGDFSGVTKTIGGTSMTVQDFDRNGDWNMEMSVPKNTSARVWLQWNDRFGASGNDYDLYITDSTGNTVYASSTTTQNGSGNPYEYASVTNGTGSTAYYYVVIRKHSGSDKRLKIVTYEGNFEEYPVAAGSIMGFKCSNSLIAVGAIKHSTPAVIESYSSRGPVRIDFPAIESRQKPDLCGIDGVAVTGNGGFGTPFYGTSAAAPHIAALAALVWSSNTGLTSIEVRNKLQNNCVDLGAQGYDNVYGYGRANVYKIFSSPPSAPSPASCRQSRDQIILSWTAGSQGNIAGYRIYRGLLTAGPYTMIASVDATKSSYTDTVTQEGTYYYKISAYDPMADLESPLSAPISVTVSFALSDAFIFPNPLKIGQNAEVTFGGLSGNETIRIYTISGELVTSAQLQGALQWKWRGTNSAGYLVARGVYIYMITRPTGEKRIGKIAVVE